MNKLIKITGIFLLIFLVGIAFADSNKTEWNILEKASGTQITSAAICDGGSAIYTGSQDGKINLVNMSGSRAYDKAATGPVVSIVPTAGNNLGAFSYITENRVFTYKNSSCINLDFTLDKKPKSLVYDKTAGLYCQTFSNSIYLYSNGIWEPVDQNSNLFNQAENSGKIYSVNDSQSNLQSSDAHSVSSNHSMFTWTPDGEIKGCLSAGLTNNNDNPVTVAFVSDVYDSARQATGDAIYRITIHGAAFGQDYNKQTGKCDNYLFGKNFGFNAVSYDISCPEDSKYNKTEYPILGYRYTENGTAKTGTLAPNDISFLWKGPECTEKDGQYKVNVVEHIYDFAIAQQIPISNAVWQGKDGITADLKKSDTWKPASGISYSIEIDNATSSEIQQISDINCVPNGVCLTPVVVRISYSDPATQTTKYLPSDNDAYNHLFFYDDAAGTQSFAADDLIFGNSPYSDYDPAFQQYSNDDYYISVLPQNIAEINIDGNRLVKYGSLGPQIDNGRVFYITAGHKLSSPVNIGVCLIYNSQNSIIPLNAGLTIKPEPSSVDLDQATKFTSLNTENGRNFVLTDGIEVSSWEGLNDGQGAGYLDYVVPKKSGSPQDNAPAGIFAVFPQGLNDLQLFPDRLNPAAMHVGYYFKPIGNLDGLHAGSYQINDKTSYCASLVDKPLYAYLFDQYGDYVTYTATDNNIYHKYWAKPVHDNYTHIRLTNWSNVPICVHGYVYHHKTDKTYNTLGGIPEYDKGVFLPPDPDHSSKGETFTTKYKAEVNGDGYYTTFHTFADALCSTDAGQNGEFDPEHYDYFTSSLQYSNPSSLRMAFKTFIYVPKHIQDSADAGLYDDLYLPVNQIYFYNIGGEHIDLDYWGVHFVEWNRSCDCGNTTSERYYNRGKSNSDKEWLFCQNGWYETEHGSDGKVKIHDVGNTFKYSDLISDPSIEGTSDGVLQIADDTPVHHKCDTW